MTTYQNNRGEKWLLVPNDSELTRFEIETLKSNWLTGYVDGITLPMANIFLPPANYTLICTSDEITEEQARKVVDNHELDGMFKDYVETKLWYNSPTKSFHSLLHSLSLSRVVVLKNEE